jgi:glycosyltransferase involved in cell wall biosynthesis
MRILICCPAFYLKRELGAAKVSIELAEELERLGWGCKLVALYDLVPANTRNVISKYSIFLRQYLQKYASDFDVVEYDHSHLPFPRSEFSQRTLFVARSVLLTHHFDKIVVPDVGSLRSKVRGLLNNNLMHRRRIRRRTQMSLREADLINVANYDDKKELVQSGVQAEKITIIPYGISKQRRAFFNAVSSETPSKPKIAFVGTFDSRKGASDFPHIVRNICLALPEVTFKLLGTVRSKTEVLNHFPEPFRNKIEVVPQYPAERLHELLAECSIGIFPSYIEGFGFGVLEMLAASVPVIAYDAPGPNMMLSADYLVHRGDIAALCSKAINLINDGSKLSVAREMAKHRSEQFCWEKIAQQTSQIYTEWVYAKRRELKQLNVAAG